MPCRPLAINTIITLCSVSLLVLSGRVAAEETVSYGQQILPIDCLYEVVDSGTQTLRYLTPETCPVEPEPPIVSDTSNGGTPASLEPSSAETPASPSAIQWRSRQPAIPANSSEQLNGPAEIGPNSKEIIPDITAVLDFVIKRYVRLPIY